MSCATSLIWTSDYLAYDFGDHPMTPVRLDLTVRLAREAGVLDRVTVLEPAPATETELLTVHDAGYLAALRMASIDPAYVGYGLGTDDDPVFPGMFDAAALIAGRARGTDSAAPDPARGQHRRQLPESSGRAG